MKKLLIFVVTAFISSNAFAYSIVTRTKATKNIKEEIIQADGFISCRADNYGEGGTCKIWQGFAVIADGTYKEVLQKIKPGAIFKGFSINPTGRDDHKEIHIFYVMLDKVKE